MRGVRILRWKRNLWLYPCDGKQASNTTNGRAHTVYTATRLPIVDTIMSLVGVFERVSLAGFMYSKPNTKSYNHQVTWKWQTIIFIVLGQFLGVALREYVDRGKESVCWCALFNRIACVLSHILHHITQLVGNWCNETNRNERRSTRTNKQTQTHAESQHI